MNKYIVSQIGKINMDDLYKYVNDNSYKYVDKLAVVCLRWLHNVILNNARNKTNIVNIRSAWWDAVARPYCEKLCMQYLLQNNYDYISIADLDEFCKYSVVQQIINHSPFWITKLDFSNFVSWLNIDNVDTRVLASTNNFNTLYIQYNGV